jgi:hypothetical protein
MGFLLSIISAEYLLFAKNVMFSEQGREDHPCPILVRERNPPDDKE